MSGAPIIAWISIDPDAFAITKGAPAHYASSPAISRQFCGACGAQLTYARDDDDSFLDVATATLDNPNAFAPTHHSWLSDDLAWVEFGDGLPTFPQGRYDPD